MLASEDRIRVVVIDDHPFFRDGLRSGLSQSGFITVVGEASTGHAGLELMSELRPQVAVVDYQMPDLDGIALAQAAARSGLEAKVLILSAFTDSTHVFRALEAGASGYFSKDARRAEIVEAVRSIARGDTVVPADLAGALAGEIRFRAQAAWPALSGRELDVLRGFARGLSIPQLSRELFIGASTVKTHAHRLYEKLGVSDRAAAVAEGMRRGLVE